MAVSFASSYLCSFHMSYTRTFAFPCFAISSFCLVWPRKTILSLSFRTLLPSVFQIHWRSRYDSPKSLLKEVAGKFHSRQGKAEFSLINHYWDMSLINRFWDMSSIFHPRNASRINHSRDWHRIAGCPLPRFGCYLSKRDSKHQSQLLSLYTRFTSRVAKFDIAF